MVRTVVFDLDGTLVDSAADIRDALNRVLADAGRRLVSLDEARNMIGDGMDKVVERGFRATGEPASGEDLARHYRLYREVYRTTDVAHTRPYPGVVETLERLRDDGCRLAVCTNKLADFALDILTALELRRFFDAVVGADSTPVRKPHPGALTAAVEGVGGRLEDTVMVGDSAVDVAVARAAGVPVVAVAYGYARMPPGELGADALIARFEALSEALARLPAGGGPRPAAGPVSLTAATDPPYIVPGTARAAPKP